MKKLNIIESILIVLGLVLFGVGSKIESVHQAAPWLQYAGLILVFITGLSDAIYRIVAKKSFLK
ncbi:hypothetical protein RA086_09530 [Lactiplantibacillus sp. WILCCON 0030]|uniref:Uncharacterized protein n=1 Tax=Lactiplantibacillus brownii TaxID=3069269 RepID=A0ABU1AA44_9LACO|nr:hypothetical protein [Lactiplantibacillus brownii]MDQ7937847.1 hypothetical protein [Lactiplantibacillus brownii]